MAEREARVVRFRIPDRLPPDVLKTFRHLIERTDSTGKEHAAALCVTRDGRLTVGKTCEGTECAAYVEGPPGCSPGEIQVGLFHTHPPGTAPVWSMGDVLHKVASCYHNPNYVLNCLGSPDSKYIVCHVLKERRKERLSDLYQSLETGTTPGDFMYTIYRVLPSMIYDEDGRLIPENSREHEKAIREISLALFKCYLRGATVAFNEAEIELRKDDPSALREYIDGYIVDTMYECARLACNDITAHFGREANILCRLAVDEWIEEHHPAIAEGVLRDVLASLKKEKAEALVR